jgi:hypothetical protein
MSAESDGPEENAFELDGLIARPKTANSKAAPKAELSRPRKPRRKELFARITRRHCMLLVNVERISTVILFNHLMMYSVKVFHRPFELPVGCLAKETGLNRRAQIRAMRDLAKIGIVKVERETPHGLPVVSIPGTTKSNRKAT